MNPDYTSMKKVLWPSVLAGIIWGWLAFVLGLFTGAFLYESTLLHNLSAFTIGGALFGLISGGFLALSATVVPLRSVLLRAVIVSTSIWIIFRAGGFVLTWLNNMRFHADISQTLQGLAMAVVLGVLLGAMWKKGLKGA